MKKKITTNIKKNVFYIALIGVLLVIGGSFALFTANFIGDKYQVINLNGLMFRYTEEDSAIYMDKAEPMSDEDGKKLDNYFDFNIYLKYTNNYSIPYAVLLEELENNTVDPKYIKVYLTDQNDNEIIAPTKMSDLALFKNGDYLLHSTEISTEGIGNNTQYYRLRTWIDESYTPELTYGTEGNVQTGFFGYGTFSFRVNVSSNLSLDNTMANAPVLASNMIPVYYDGSNWVKADELNQDKNHQWYDYSSKMWANAVTVNETGYRIGTIEDNQTVDIANQVSKPTYYRSTNTGLIQNSTSSSIFTFTAGSDGEYSFDWSLESYTGDTLTITINDVVLSNVNAIYGYKSGTYTGTAVSGTTYTIVASYSQNGDNTFSGDNMATIGNFKLPSGSTSITNSLNNSYPNYQWEEYTVVKNSMKFYERYQLYNKKIVLSNGSDEGNIIGKYICSDTTSTTCDEIFEIIEYNDTAITKIRKYSNILDVDRDYYLNSDAGTMIDMSNINTMMVWIPRFSATGDTANYNGGTQAAPGAFDITFVDKNTPAHDAFTFGSQNLSGMWIGKFENSSDTTCSTSSASAVGSGCNLNTIRPKIIPNVTSWRGAMVSTFFYDMQNMTESGNQYGFDKTIDTTLDTHMLKNNEWGAVAYLTQSVYGRCTSSTNCTEVGINNNSSYITGYGAPAGSSYYSGNSTYVAPQAYNTTQGMDASTTGNIYGVYDMSGGSSEYVMGVYTDGTKLWSGYSNSSSYPNYHSGFNGWLGYDGTNYEDGVEYPNDDKYYNVYTTESDYRNTGLQHALIETKNWYGDYAYFVDSFNSWFRRGGGYSDSSSAGVFYFSYYNGRSNTNYGSRSSIIIN